MDVFKKLATLHTKNSFSFALICGDLFANPSTASKSDEDTVSQLLDNTIKVPLTTYFTVDKHPLPTRIIERLNSSDGEVCENLYYLGNRTVLNTADGVKIVALGGRHDSIITAGLTKDRYSPFFTVSDLKSLYGANSADILLTSTWPASVRKGSSITLPDDFKEPPSLDLVSELCSRLKPRYHFSSSDSFFEREPFRHPAVDEGPALTRITRFISLASFGNANKQKWLYAFSIDPKQSDTSAAPVGTTPSPFLSSIKKRAASAAGEFNHRFSSATDHRPSKRARRPPPGPEECFFCLSNPTLATHLIASIGDESYLTAARGPLPSPDTFQSLPGSSHILIIPLAHYPRLADIPEADVRSSTTAEMNRYRKALQSMVHSRSKGQLGAVTWEVSRRKGVHAHWQFLPVGDDMIAKGLVEAAFKVEAENEQYSKLESVDSEHFQDMDHEGDCFRLWIFGRHASSRRPNDRKGSKSSTDDEDLGDAQEKRLILPLDEDTRFNLQFGRQVMAKLLGLEGRINWKDCLQSQVEETEDVEGFKSAFREHDFSAENEGED